LDIRDEERDLITRRRAPRAHHPSDGGPKASIAGTDPAEDRPMDMIDEALRQHRAPPLRIRGDRNDRAASMMRQRPSAAQGSKESLSPPTPAAIARVSVVG